jgi:hypothetical protein
MNKLRISLTQKDDVIKGIVALSTDPLFVLECLHMVLEQFAKNSGVTPEQIAVDLLLFTQGKVK